MYTFWIQIMHLHLLVSQTEMSYFWVPVHICQKLGEMINFLYMLDFDEKLVCLYSIVKVYVANQVF